LGPRFPQAPPGPGGTPGKGTARNPFWIRNGFFYEKATLKGKGKGKVQNDQK